MNPKTLKKGCAIALVLYCVCAALFYWIGGDQLRFRESQSDMLTPTGTVGAITSEIVLEQPVAVAGDLLAITFVGATYARENTGVLNIEVCDLYGNVLAKQAVDMGTIQDNMEFSVQFLEAVSVPDGCAVLRITAPEATPENAVTLYYGTTMSAARYEVEMPLSDAEKAVINGQLQEYALSTRVFCRETLLFGRYYWFFAAAMLGLLALVCGCLLWKNHCGKPSRILMLCIAIQRYRYLMKQLVERDFKTKYKRSVLGILWSFLNPLLTMTVQYIVFSTLFKSDIPNFALYLLIGIVCFNFFNEATAMSLMSIVGNASLITKVYVPKYIYPLTRVMSSAINFLLALIPLFFVMLLTGEPIRPTVLLLPMGICCLFCVSLGIGMLLSSVMVFFRDTQFLWGVISMLWMYATPIFYPESIIPSGFMTLYKMNPLYHIIRFIRILLIDGISPEPKAYALMVIASVAPLLLGVIVFKKTQDRFVLNL